MTHPPTAAPATARLFVAVWPGAAERAGLLRWQAACRWPPGARPASAERLHLTLHFLGDVPGQRLPALAGGLDVPSAPFELLLDRAAVWPNGVAVLLPAAVPPALRELHDRLGDALRRLGLPFDARPFRPHVTLARRAAGAALPAHEAAVRWHVHGHVLVASEGGYRVLHRYG